MNPADLQKLVSTPMPFGKHKGVPLAVLPGNELTCFAREGFLWSEIGRLWALLDSIDHMGLSDLLRQRRGVRLAGGVRAPTR